MAIDIEKILKGLAFPAGKEAILSKSRENGAGEEEISALEGLLEREYGDMAEINEALMEDEEESKEDTGEDEDVVTDDEEA